MVTQELELYYEDEDVTLELERYEYQIYLHAKVRKWSPSIAKHSFSVLNTLFEAMKVAGYREAWSITPNPRFAKMFGATSVRQFTHENKDYEVVKWDLQ